jgi:dTDP-glucose 4,6-dehydratase
MKCYLITGGAGFIGSNYIHYLMSKYKDGIRIINLDSLTYCGNRSNLSNYEGNNNYTFIQGDICNEKLVKMIFTDYDIDYVIHFAAQTHVDRSIASSREFVETNVAGTLNLLNSAKDTWVNDDNHQNKRFLYVSTDEVYGALPSDGYFTEKSPICPRNPYSASKAAADMMAHAFYETYGLPVLVTRCSNNYGPYQYEEKFIPLCIKSCLCGKEVPIYGDGQNIRDWLYVMDHCKAIDNVIQNGTIGEVYNVGGHNEYTNLEIADIVSNILNEEFGIPITPIKFVDDRKGHDRRYAIDPTKIINELGWKMETPFCDGIRQTIHWYMEHKDFLKINDASVIWD